MRDPREIALEEAAKAKAYQDRIQAVIAQLRDERERKREALAAEMNSDDNDAEDNVDYDAEDLKEATRIVDEEEANKALETKQDKLRKKMLHLPFEETDYQMRRASQEYACIRSLKNVTVT